MRRQLIAAAIAAASFAVCSNGRAAPLFATGFEAVEGYTNNTQLASNANWSGNGQDSAGWLVTNATIGGSGPKSGSQWVLASAPTADTRFQWTVTPVVTPSIITGTVDVKLVSNGTINRTSIAGIQMYTEDVTLIGQLNISNDPENMLGNGPNEWYAEFGGADDGGFVNVFDLGSTNLLDQYVTLQMVWDMNAETLTASVNGNLLPQTATTTGLTDFHDLDLFTSRSSATAGGTAARAGFDNYSVSADVPEPASLALIGLATGGLLSRRRRA